MAIGDRAEVPDDSPLGIEVRRHHKKPASGTMLTGNVVQDLGRDVFFYGAAKNVSLQEAGRENADPFPVDVDETARLIRKIKTPELRVVSRAKECERRYQRARADPRHNLETRAGSKLAPGGKNADGECPGGAATRYGEHGGFVFERDRPPGVVFGSRRP